MKIIPVVPDANRNIYTRFTSQAEKDVYFNKNFTKYVCLTTFQQFSGNRSGTVVCFQSKQNIRQNLVNINFSPIMSTRIIIVKI